MFKFKTEPMAHQLKGFELSKELPNYALFMEPRTGKTKLTLDTAAYLFQERKIKTLLVAAFPNGLHRNWITDEAPIHLAVEYKAILWNAQSTTRRWEKETDIALAYDGFLLVAVNVEAIPTERCRIFLRKVLKRGPCMSVIDESTCIGTPGAQRTKIALKLGALSEYTRILTGTPVDEGPLRLYSQFWFLNPNILNFTSFYSFKHYFAEWEEGFNGATDTKFEKLKAYKNLDILQERIAPYSFRVLKKDCFDTPPEIYQKRYFQLAPEQRRVYNQLREEYLVEIGDGRATATHVLTRMLRLQQIACGYLPLDREVEVCQACAGEGCALCSDLGMIGGELRIAVMPQNPKLEAFKDEVSKVKNQFIVWAKFNNDIDLIGRALDELGTSWVRYDGQVNEDQRAENKRLFQTEQRQGFVGKARAGGRGLELAMARTRMYYNNEFSLELRKQSGDRDQSLKQKHSVDVIDFVGEDTVEEHIIDILRDKRDVAAMVMGDPKGEWL